MFLHQKWNYFKRKIRFLGNDIYQGIIPRVTKVIEFASKFLDEIKYKTQLQSLGCLNNDSDFFPN